MQTIHVGVLLFKFVEGGAPWKGRTMKLVTTMRIHPLFQFVGMQQQVLANGLYYMLNGIVNAQVDEMLLLKAKAVVHMKTNPWWKLQLAQYQLMAEVVIVVVVESMNNFSGHISSRLHHMGVDEGRLADARATGLWLERPQPACSSIVTVRLGKLVSSGSPRIPPRRSRDVRRGLRLLKRGSSTAPTSWVEAEEPRFRENAIPTHPLLL